MKEKVEFFMNFLTCVLSIEKKKKYSSDLGPFQSKLYSHNGCYLHYLSSYNITKYLKLNPPTQKGASVKETVDKRR